ncbi:MAG: DNA alkylation repair protein [Anaerolineae bacterium]
MAEPRTRWQPEQVVGRLQALADPVSLAGMARYGLGTDNAYGVRMPDLRALAKEIGRDHDLAERLWTMGVRETRLIATLIADPKRVDEDLMERWVADFADWEVCDQCCMNLFEHTPFAYAKAFEWSAREAEYVKRAGFVLMARLAVKEKRAPTDYVLPFLDAIRREACDDRNMVKKGVSWALRHVGERDLAAHALAVETAQALRAMDCRAARWVASDALTGLRSEAALSRLAKRAASK